MASRHVLRPFIVFAVLGGVVSLIVGLAGSVILGIGAGLLTFGIGFGGAVLVSRQGRVVEAEPADPSRRRFLMGAGLGGITLAVIGAPIGWMARKLARPDPRPAQQAMAQGLGSEYMELVRRAYRPGRSGDLQLLLAPFNSSNYANESVSLVPQDPRTSHASVWMYLERIPLVVYGPGFVEAGDNTDRVTLADLAPTTAQLIGAETFPAGERQGAPLPLDTAGGSSGDEPKPLAPAIMLTFIIDGGGWNVLQRWPDAWPNLRALMRDGANFRNAIHGSFPAVTACAHATIGTGTYPDEHGITGHNIRDAQGVVRKAYGEPGDADPADIVVPTLSDLWYEETDGRAWVGEIGYQVWHLGMLGYGGRDRADDFKPVGVYWDEERAKDWAPHNPDRYRLPQAMPDRASFDAAYQAFWDAPPDWDEEFTPQGRQAPCCSPPVVTYQGDLIEATLDSEPIGADGVTSLLYTTFKSPDYTGHIYGMNSEWERLQLEAVDAELGRVRRMLEDRFPGRFVMIVTADHGQCPLPDATGGVRLDPIQLDEHISANFAGVTGVVQEVTPHEVYLDTARLWDNGGATVEDVAASLEDYRYRQNIGPYVPADAIEQDLLDAEEFAAVFASTYMDSIADADLGEFGETSYPEGDEVGIPEIPVSN